MTSLLLAVLQVLDEAGVLSRLKRYAVMTSVLFAVLQVLDEAGVLSLL